MHQINISIRTIYKRSASKMRSFILSICMMTTLFAQKNYISVISNISYAKENNTLFNPKGELFSHTDFKEFVKLNHNLTFTGLTFDWALISKTNSFKDQTSEFSFRELYYERSISENMDFTIGRKIFRQGTGYYKNPAAFLNTNKEANDISDQLKNRVGRDILAFNYYFEESDLEIVYSPSYSVDQWKPQIFEHEITAKYYLLQWNTDMSFSYNYRSKQSDKAGFSIAHTVNDALEIHGEYSLQKGTEQLYHKNSSITNFTIYSASPYLKLRAEQWIQKLLFGINYTTPFNTFLIAEYVYDGSKLSKLEWQKLINYRAFLIQQMEHPGLEIPAGNNIKWIALSLNQQKEHLFYRLSQTFKDTELSFIAIHNLYDASAILIGNVDYNFGFLKSSIQALSFTGNKNSDFGSMFSFYEISFRLSLNI